MEIDKFGRLRTRGANGGFSSYHLHLLRKELKNEFITFLCEKNLDKLILSSSGAGNGSIRIQNVQTDDRSKPADVVNISYLNDRLKDEIGSCIRKLNFDKLSLAQESGGASVRIRNVFTDDNSLPTDAVNIIYLKHRIKDGIEKFVCGLNFDKLIVASEAGWGSRVRIRNVIADDDSLPTDVVSVSYLMRHLHSIREQMVNLEKRIEALENLLLRANITYGGNEKAISFPSSN